LPESITPDPPIPRTTGASNMGPVAHEYLFSPGRVTILLEDSEIRRIWTDGRGHWPHRASFRAGSRVGGQTCPHGNHQDNHLVGRSNARRCAHPDHL